MNMRRIFAILRPASRLFHQEGGRTATTGVRRPKARRVLIAAALGTGLGTGAYLYEFMRNKKQLLAAGTLAVKEGAYEEVCPPKLDPSRKMDGPVANLGLQLTLYQYQTCPFCCKVRAFLSYHGVPYDIVEVNPVLRQEIKFSKYRKVPILIVEEDKKFKQLNDSSAIISIFGTLFQDPSRAMTDVLQYYTPITYAAENGKEVIEIFNKYYLMYGNESMGGRPTKEVTEEHKWRKWTDDVMVHVLSPNIYRSPREALQAFSYFSEVGLWEDYFPAWERLLVIYIGSAAMYFVGKRLKRRHMLKDDVRESLYDVCKQWTRAIGPNRKFMGGDKPNLADLSVYGVLSSIEGCEAFQDLLLHTKIGTWYYGTKEAVDNHWGSSSVSHIGLKT